MVDVKLKLKLKLNCTAFYTIYIACEIINCVRFQSIFVVCSALHFQMNSQH